MDGRGHGLTIELVTLLGLATFGSVACSGGGSDGTPSRVDAGRDRPDSAVVGDGGVGDVGTTDGGLDGTPFVVHYYTSWTTAFVHYQANGIWTEPPGEAMRPEGDGWFVFEGPAVKETVELVFNDGAGTWDNNGDQNYHANLAEFWVKEGDITSSKPGDVGRFCDDVLCGQGTCDAQAERCICDAGYRYDAARQTCVEDLCASANCGSGVCDPETGACTDACEPDRVAGGFKFCTLVSDTSYAVTITYTGPGQIDLAGSETKLNGHAIDLSRAFDASQKTFRIVESGVSPSKYSYLLRLKRDSGEPIEPIFIPFWVGAGTRYADFGWKDAILYQVMTDRFRDGDPTNNIDNTKGSLSEVTDPRSQWQGGDFRGIIEKLDDGYFESLGINALWISSVVLGSHEAQPEVNPSDPKASSYHAYHPVATGYSELDDYGYANPIETAFGTPDELNELVNKAHARGIRVLPDLVANHVQIEAEIYKRHPEWFHPYNACLGNWDAHRLDCWFTSSTPDFNFGVAEARKALVDHAVWLAQEFNFDGYRADALKHMTDDLVRDLKTGIKARVETTVDNHDLSEEATIFYMVGESLGGWARYHVRPDMVQGQVDEGFYNMTTGSLLNFSNSLRNLAGFAVGNDTAYLSSQETFGGYGGYPGAVMGNFFGNHDQPRALTAANGDYRRLRMAQTFLMTSPGNIPMLYQGDEFGMLGGTAPDNRKMMIWSGLSADQEESRDQFRKLAAARDAHVALRRGQRANVQVEDWFWVYKVSYGDDEVYVAINRDNDKSFAPPAGMHDALGHCSGDVVPSLTSCVFVK